MSALIRSFGRPVTTVLAGLAVAASVFTTAAASANPMATANARFEAALEQYAIGHYRAAFDTFAALADEGHCEASRIALQMARYGCALYGVTFTASLAQVERWRRLPGCAATDPSAH